MQEKNPNIIIVPSTMPQWTDLVHNDPAKAAKMIMTGLPKPNNRVDPCSCGKIGCKCRG